VRALKARGTTVLLTTHYMDEAERLCDRVLIMSNGKAVCEGPPRELVESRLAREVLELDCTPAEERVLLEGLGAVKTLRSGARLFAFGDDAGQLSLRVKRLENGAKRAFVVRPANLEDLFLASTGTSLGTEA
jgi:lipooligosaccharide transport system ATP-binding protein